MIHKIGKFGSQSIRILTEVYRMKVSDRIRRFRMEMKRYIDILTPHYRVHAMSFESSPVN